MTLILVLMVVFVAVWFLPLAPEPPTEPANEPPPERVTDWIGALNYGTAPGAADAERKLLSLGARVTPELFEPVMRLQPMPSSLTGEAQLRVERLLVDFGLAGVIASAAQLNQLTVRHPAYPGAVRWLDALAPLAIEPVFRFGERAHTLFFVPMVVRRFDDFVQYEANEGGRLPPAQRQALRLAIALVWMSRHTGVPSDGAAQDIVQRLRGDCATREVTPVDDAAERERRVLSVRNRTDGWQRHLASVATFATDVAVDAVNQTFRRDVEALRAQEFGDALAAGLPAPRVVASLVDALRAPAADILTRCALARHVPAATLAPAVFASLGRNSADSGLVALELALAASGHMSEAVLIGLEHEDAVVRRGAALVAARGLIGPALALCVRHALHDGTTDALIAVELFGADAQRPLAEHWDSDGEQSNAPIQRVRTIVSRLAERQGH